MRKLSKKSARSSKASTDAAGLALVGYQWGWLSPAGRLAIAEELFAPCGLRKDGRRVRKGIITKAQFLELVDLFYEGK